MSSRFTSMAYLAASSRSANCSCSDKLKAATSCFRPMPRCDFSALGFLAAAAVPGSELCRFLLLCRGGSAVSSSESHCTSLWSTLVSRSLPDSCSAPSRTHAHLRTLHSCGNNLQHTTQAVPLPGEQSTPAAVLATLASAAWFPACNSNHQSNSKGKSRYKMLLISKKG